MSPDQLEDFIALRALDLLDAGDIRALDDALQADPAARRLASEMEATAASIALSVEQVTPPAALRTRVLAALPDPTPVVSSANTIVPFRWWPWAVAAGFALVCGLLAINNANLRRDISAAREQSQVDSLRIATLVSMLQGAPEARAVLVWNEMTQEGVLTVEKLPPPDADHDYQLWIVDPAYRTPLDGGVFSTAPDGSIRYAFRTNEPVKKINALAVSVERKGGVPIAEGPMVLVASLR